MFWLLSIAEIILVLALVSASVEFYNIVFRGFAPFISTKPKVILAILDELKLKGDETVYELGCGKAGFLQAILEKWPSVKTLGIEYHFWPYFFAKMQASLHKKAVGLHYGDLFESDLSKADVMYCFLNPPMMERLAAKLKSEAKPGAILISYMFTLPGFKTYKERKDGNDFLFFYQF
jgi:hypothetical protein